MIEPEKNLSPAHPLVVSTHPQPSAGAVPPPVINLAPAGSTSSLRKVLAIFLSLYFGLVLLQLIASLLDSTCVLFLRSPAFTALDGILLCLALLATVLTYGLMALTPMIPKRIFLSLAFLMVAPALIALPVVIYSYHRLPQIDWLVSLLQLLVALAILRWVLGGWKLRWPLVRENHLGPRAFSWRNLLLFVALNLFILLPATAGFVAECASMAVSHFTDGFMALRPSGIILQARKYVREDGRTVILFPMSHVADPEFYKSVAASFTSNSIVLMEGVTDTNHLLTNHISYKRAAKSLHLSEQHEDFTITKGHVVDADVDIHEFTTNTISILNLVMLVHAQGVNASTLPVLLQFAPTEDVEQQLFDDLLNKRNAHLLNELRTRLPDSDSFIIPWGAAHMAGISKEIQKSGFHLVATRDFVSIRFGSKPNKNAASDWIPSSGTRN